MRLRSSVIDAEGLAASDRGAMFHLMDRTYANVQRKSFEADLQGKQWIIQVHDPASGELAGFSTQVILHETVSGQAVRALFSGDTVVDRQYWGDTALAQAWGRMALQLIDEDAGMPLYWFLTSKGFRTYKYLPLFFHEWFPRNDVPTPRWERAVIDVLGSRVAPRQYNQASQIIEATVGKECVRADIADPRARARTDRHVQFFIERNPGHLQGDELCCLAPLTEANFTAAALRVIQSKTSVPLAG